MSVLILTLHGVLPLVAQSSATLQGRVFDTSGAVLRDATITVRNESTGFDRAVATDDEGRYHVEPIPAETYSVTAAASGFKSAVIAVLTFEVGRTLVRDFRLEIGETRETVVVRADAPLVDRVTTSVGHVMTPQTVQEIPLNGRHFTDLALLAPGAVAPSQTGFSTTPARGVGAVAINTAGNREEASAFHINGVSANNLTFGSLGFEPPIASIQEFKADSSVFSAEYGHVSGAIVNIVTRSGGNQFHGDAFEFLRDDALDAANYFELTSEPHLFERNQFGGSLGGPFIPEKIFFFTSYQGLLQRQGLDLNSLVLTDAQRAAATDPVVRRLIEFIPRANVFDPDGTPHFVGSAAARVETNHWTFDFSQNIGRNDRLHAFYGRQHYETREPTVRGTSIPGFGTVASVDRALFTLSETRIFGPAIVNEVRFGRNGIDGVVSPAAELNPADFGLRNGVTRPIGLPQFFIAGGLNFGGPADFPAGRDDTSYVFGDTLSVVNGRHAVRAGGEYRHFINENFAETTGAFNFPTVAAFLAGTANAFTITLGERTSVIDQRALGLFVQDRYTIHPRVTLDVGLRYEWHVTPTERNDKFVVFDPGTASLQRVGIDIDDEIYQQNNRNIEPRVGVAWDLAGDGRTVVRGVYGVAVDEPGTTAVTGTAANPPFGIPLGASGSIPLDNAIERTATTVLSPATVDPRFRNASMRSWNVNLQRQLGGQFAVMTGYFGSKGRNLRISRNINQPVDGVRPFIALSPSSPILPGAALGNIIQVESSAFSSYDALWVSATKRLSRGLQADASYTWSRSRDTNSLNSSGFAIQDAYNIPNEYGLSDFDARHRVVLSALYELPFTGHWSSRDWQLALIVQSQSGNPVNIVTSTSTLNGLPNTVRPDVTGPIQIVGSVDEWFETSAFVAVDRFGNLGRNVVIGPAFHNTDLSVIRNVQIGGRGRLQFRADFFDLFNHANFGPPGNIVGSPTFGKITRTRFPTGEAGSSRQIQLGVKLTF